ncbi:MAG: helix-turn-helix domain-containing protein [Candidatus Nanoarchaeia archaeon]
MGEMDILKEFFDEKVIDIMNLFFERPEKQFYLTEVSHLSKVNITTAFRILNKLTQKGFLKASMIGKTKVYELEKTEKIRNLSKIMIKKEGPLNEFVERIKIFPRITKIILEAKSNSSAKLIIVGELVPHDKLLNICNDIKSKYNYIIDFVDISENQFQKLKDFSNYNLEKKVIWKS